MAEDDIKPDTYSASMTIMLPEWQLIRDVRGGARTVRAAGEKYLPKFAAESDDDYKARVATAPFSAHYEDSTRSLVGKPFGQPVALQGSIPPDIKTWSENVDNAGSDLHNFAKKAFGEALHMGIGFILVDHTTTGDARTRAQEKAVGARPYFRFVPILDTYAPYLGIRNGATYLRQFRFRDDETVIDGLEEKTIKRVRQFDDIDGVLSVTTYVQDGKGKWTPGPPAPLTSKALSGLPVVPVIFGNEMGGPFVIKPPMADLAHKQIEHYRHANRLDNVYDHAGFPILQGKGLRVPLNAETGKPEMPNIGPRAVLYAPPSQGGDRPEWGFISPDAGMSKELREHKKDLETEMRTLGLQPHMPSAGIQNMAATTSAISAARTHSSIKAWAIMLKDAIEQAFVFMAQWRGLPETTEVWIHTDFAPEVLGDKDEKLLLEALSLGKITWDTWADEMQRRDILGPQFDKDAERERLEAGDDPLSMGLGNNLDDPEPKTPAEAV